MFTIKCVVDNKSLDVASFQSEHGVAFAIQTPTGQVLFDTGQSGHVLVHNAARLDIDLRQINALALSHAHYDHTGGLNTFLRNSLPGIPLYAHPDITTERYSMKDNQLHSVGMRMPRAELMQRVTPYLSTEPCQIFPGIWTTGEITPRTEFLGSSAHHFIKSDLGLQPDPYLDDMALVLETRTGLAVICGCCHAGILNTLAHVRQVFNRQITMLIGGAHLASVGQAVLEHAITVLRATSAGQLPDLYLNHCTGEHALSTMAQAFGEKVHPCPAGTILEVAS